MSERVWARAKIAIPGQTAGFSVDDLWPWMPHEDRPCWIKYLRVYEYAPTFEDPEVLDVLADAFHVGNRDSVDEVIRNEGIVGCWRPSSILVGRFTDYAVNRMVVDSPVVAHALWNTDLHVASQRHHQLGLELHNDSNHPRWIRVAFHTVAMTDAELGFGPPDHEVQQHLDRYATETDKRLVRLERELAVFQKQHRELMLALNKMKGG